MENNFTENGNVSDRDDRSRDQLQPDETAGQQSPGGAIGDDGITRGPEDRRVDETLIESDDPNYGVNGD